MVNALVSTAVGQLEAMETLKRSQEELKQLTAESLQRVVSTQEGLLSQQETLRGGQVQMEEALSSNLERLVQEKALIASGQRQKQTTLYHDELLGKLRKMNETFGLVLQTMEHMQTKVEGRLQHIQRFISWAGFSLNSVYTCVLHVLYFLLAALIMTFLQIPGASRALLLVVVVANALFELHHTVSLGFTSLTGLLALSVAGKLAFNVLLGRICCHALRHRTPRPLRAPLPLPHKAPQSPACKAGLQAAKRGRVTSTPDREGEVGLLHELEKLEEVSYLSDGFPLKTDSLKNEDLLASTQGKRQESRALGSSRPARPLRRVTLSRCNKTEVTQRSEHAL
ncbi:hypothetical protein Chor_010628 [Crotalus horridus]